MLGDLKRGRKTVYSIILEFYIYVFYNQMKDKTTARSFTLKIADLLNETWKSDEIVFDSVFSQQLPNVDTTWISWTFSIQSLDEDSLLWTLQDVKVTLHEVCDSCGVDFVRSVHIPLYTSRFVFEKDISEDEKVESDDPLLFINPKDDTINIEDMIVQSILLDDPFVKRCDQCVKRLEAVDDDEDEFGEYTSQWNITFS